MIFSFHAAEDILNEFRDRFITEMDASTVALDLFHSGIIPDGVQERIVKADGQTQRNSTLHECLLRTCTNDALMRACDIITSVQGNPKMSDLGKDMKKRLESGVCVCVHAWVPTFVLPCMVGPIIYIYTMHAFSEADLSQYSDSFTSAVLLVVFNPQLHCSLLV